MNIFQTLDQANNNQICKQKKMEKCIHEKMKCGLLFQYLPESIHMVRRYEIITEQCKQDILKKINTAKWKYKWDEYSL